MRAVRSIQEAKQIQERLRERVVLRPLTHAPTTIAGADVSFSRGDDTLYAAFVVFSYPDLVEGERAYAMLRADFPYVPGYLSFRELPVLLKAYHKLCIRPDLIVVDGQGIAHPRRLGIATHLGIELDTPTIGCGKSLLYGKAAPPASVFGSTAPLVDPKTSEHIGVLLRSKVRANPLVISPGNDIALEESIAIVKSCLQGYRSPLPTRRAHVLANEFRKHRQAMRGS